MAIRSIGRKYDLDVGCYTWATPVNESEETREEVVDETKRLESVKGLYGSNGVKDSTKRNSINILV